MQKNKIIKSNIDSTIKIQYKHKRQFKNKVKLIKIR